jgi:hypothetical protein
MSVLKNSTEVDVKHYDFTSLVHKAEALKFVKNRITLTNGIHAESKKKIEGLIVHL